MTTLDAPRFVRRLHREDRGNIWVMLLMFYIFVIFSAVGFTWNTTQVTTKSIQTQMVADAVVYNAALTKARAMNLAVATDIAINQNLSANVLLNASPLATIIIFINWAVSMAQIVASLPWSLGQLIDLIAEIIWFFANFGIDPMITGLTEFIQGTLVDGLSGTGGGDTLAGRVRLINEFQKELIELPDKVIEDMVRSYEERYNCDILIGDAADEASSGTDAPDREVELADLPLNSFGTRAFQGFSLEQYDIAIPLLIRVYRDHEHWYNEFQANVKYGKGAQAWRFSCLAMYLVNLLLLSNRTVTLEDPVGIPILEWTPGFGVGGQAPLFMDAAYGEWDSSLLSYDDSDNEMFKDYAITAAVMLRNVGNAATPRVQAQPGAGRFGAKGRYLFDGWFSPGANWDDSTVAVASAEFYNPTMNRLTAPVDVPYPYRMFTTWGWNWQARLREVHPDFLGAGIRSDGEHIRLRSHMEFNQIDGNNHLPPADSELGRALRAIIYH